MTEDIEQIKQLQARFWYACDGAPGSGRTHDVNALVELFTPDGVFAAMPAGTVIHGHRALQGHFQSIQEQIPFAFHIGSDPIIELSGDTATGRWRNVTMLTLGAAGGRGHYLSANLYEVAYARLPEGWRIERCELSNRVFVPAAHDWTDRSFLSAWGPSAPSD